MKTICTNHFPGQYDVAWKIDGRGRHHVSYGAESEQFPKGQSLEAGRLYGEFIRHQLECAGCFSEEAD